MRRKDIAKNWKKIEADNETEQFTNIKTGEKIILQKMHGNYIVTMDDTEKTQHRFHRLDIAEFFIKTHMKLNSNEK